MKWINKHLEVIALWSVILAVLWVIFGPLILTQTIYTIRDFAGGENNTGLIGDTIGGITAPIVGLISVVLLYLALIKQIESNRISVHEANFRIIYSEIGELKNATEKYSYAEKFGNEATVLFAMEINKIHLAKELTNSHVELLDKYNLLLGKFNRIFYLLDNLKTSEDYKDILSKDLQQIVSIHFVDGFNTIFKWEVEKEKWFGGIEYKMFMVKSNSKKVLDEVLERNKK